MSPDTAAARRGAEKELQRWLAPDAFKMRCLEADGNRTGADFLDVVYVADSTRSLVTPTLAENQRVHYAVSFRLLGIQPRFQQRYEARRAGDANDKIIRGRVFDRNKFRWYADVNGTGDFSFPGSYRCWNNGFRRHYL